MHRVWPVDPWFRMENISNFKGAFFGKVIKLKLTMVTYNITKIETPHNGRTEK